MGRDLLRRLLRPDPPPFALLRRPEATGPGVVELLTGPVSTVDSLAELPGDRCALALVPFRQIAERGFACHDDGTPLLVLHALERHALPLDEVLRAIPETPVVCADGGFDVDDDTYAQTVRKVLDQEIGTGEGANFVLARAFRTRLEDFSGLTALTIFRRLLAGERGAYWTFLVHTGSRTLLGATPERHVSLREGVVCMNPISGTYRHPAGGPTKSGLLRFLHEAKEVEELSMVVDEELKMLARISGSGLHLVGPRLKQMAHLTHTEYLLRAPVQPDVRELLRETMFAPTVTGSPLQNACRVIERYEQEGRGYYAGLAALLDHDDAGRAQVDAPILIRTAEIDAAGTLCLRVGATLVRDSDPRSEALETRAKAAGVLSALGLGACTEVPPPPPVDDDVHRALSARNATLSRFWLAGHSSLPALPSARTLVVDAEDSFAAMLAHQLSALGLDVVVHGHADLPAVEEFDLVVLGPGPGDPRNDLDPKIRTLRSVARRLLDSPIPLFGVCLGHQVIADLLGLRLVRKEGTYQGTQRVIDLFGRPHRVGFYSTFTACAPTGVLPGAVELSRDPVTGEVHALRAPGFASVQFHPESVLTEHGPQVLASVLGPLLAGSTPRSRR